MVAHNLERPHERPAVGMELGGGDVELGKKLPLKPCKGKPEFHLLEQGCVNEAEGPAVVRLVISTNWQVGEARQHCHLFVVLLVKRLVRLVSLYQS